MLNVQKKQIKTIDDYRHSIKLLKYHLKKESKQNQKLKYESAKAKHVRPAHHTQTKSRIYSLSDTVKTVSTRIKRMGLALGDLFRMADQTYEGEITKQQFMKCAHRLKTDLEDSLFTEMFYAIDTNFNGMVCQEEFSEFSIAYGGCTDSKQIRKYQKKIKSKLALLIQQKKGNYQNFLNLFPDPIPAAKFKSQIAALGLSDNETMLMLKTFDPSHQGNIRHKVFLSLMESVKAKTDKQQKQEEYEKGIQQLCAQWRQQKLNPIDIFEEADVDGKEGVSAFELQQAFKKLMPGETNFQIKKWVAMINLNNDAQITKEEFLNSIRSFYSLNQMSKFSAEYEKKHPELQKKQGEEESVQSIMKELSIKIEDSGMTKKDTFNFLDFNKNGEISKEEMFEGLKRMGLNIRFIGRVMSVFDRDSSGEVSLEEWLRILGEDFEVEDVPIPDDIDFDDEDMESEHGQKSKPLSKKKATKKPDLKKPQIGKEQTKGKSNLKQTKIQGNKTMKRESKVKDSKQNANKTQKQSQVKKPSGIAGKKFVEDNMNKTKDKNKKETVKQKAKPTPKPTPKPESSDHDSEANKFQQPEEIDLEPTETLIAKDYKKNKKSILRIFQKYDRRNTGEISPEDFNKALSQGFKTNIQESIRKEIYMKNCSSGGKLEYENWLDEISDMYAQDVSEEEEKDEEKQQKQKQEQEQEESEEEKVEGEQEQEQQKGKSKNLDHDAQKASKRGENISEFLDLLTLKITSSKNIEKKIAEDKKEGQKSSSYKFINYIDEQGNFIKKRNSLLEKARLIKKSGQKYKDLDFPPQIKSIYSGGDCQIANVKMLKWKHFSQLYKNPQLFAGIIEPNDIKQGSLGDCYFLSALACLAQYRNMIERLFEYSDMENGYFIVWMCIDGMWRLVELDGYLPVSPDGRIPAFSRSNQQQIWVLLLEKAYAKCYGNYNNIVGGQPFEAIKDLSGAPGQQYSHDKISMDIVWQKLVEANKKQYMMTAATKMDGGEHHQQGHQEGITSQGVVLGHAYSILDVHLVKKTGERIIQLRNPWGETEWKGDWSDNSNKWAGDIGIKYERKADDGIFWMSLKDFFINFVSIAINFISPKNYYQASPQKNIEQFAIRINTKEFQNGYFMVSQIDHRHKGLPPNTPYSLCHMIGFVTANGKLIEKMPQKRFLYAREGVMPFLDVSKYGDKNCEVVVLVQLEKSTDVIVGFYSDKPEADFQISSKDCTTLSEQLAKADEENPTCQTVPNQMKIWLSQVQNLGFLCFKNISGSEITWNVEIENPDNLKIVAPTLPRNVIKLKAGEVRCLVGRLVDMKKGFNFRQKISY